MLQNIINLASNLEINRRKMTGVVYTRSEIPVASLTTTKNPWRFIVTVAPQPWDNMRSIIEYLDNLDRYQPDPQSITFNSNSLIASIYRYRGDYPTIPIGITVSSFSGNQLTLSNLNTAVPIGGGFSSTSILFAAGDLIQISGYPNPYTVVTNVLRGSTDTVTVTTHRPRVTTASVSNLAINVGPLVQWQFFVPSMPTYQLQSGAYRYNGSGYDNSSIVTWSEPFQLYEWVTQ